MRRRNFIAALGSLAITGPASGQGQQAVPVIGFLRDAPAKGSEYLVSSFARGLVEAGLLRGQDFNIELGMSEGRRDRLAALAKDFANRPVALIAASATSATVAAAHASTSVPIVFAFPSDPVQLGLVKSMNKPGTNVTGVTYLNTELTGKRIGILRDLLTQLTTLAVLINPKGSNAEETVREINDSALSLSIKPRLLRASSASEIDKAFQEVRGLNVDALVIGNDAYFTTERVRITQHASAAGIVTNYAQREFAESGGLISYGANLPEAYRLAGGYAARILKRGEQPANLPVIQPTKFELVINVATAKLLSIKIPDRIMALADAVIE
jgi:putative ABC transport system substrate-binding protein